MCGVVGLWSQPTSPDELRHVVDDMAAAVLVRGPDSGGAWVDGDAGLGLGHRRLAIIDLSPEGYQPMVSASGRYVISYNGEVYNFGELRAELEAQGHTKYRGHSDTEVMLTAFDAWGLVEAVKRFVGIFAFALWDREERRLHLVRDPLGVKPLCFGTAGKSLVFGSELKSLVRHPRFDRTLDRRAVTAFLRANCIPAPLSIYKAASKVLPGTIVTFKEPRADAARVTRYWSAAEVARAGTSNPFKGTEEEAVEALDGLLRRSVKEQMVADVPVGAFLSGGVDSSTVVALMQAQATRKVRTFSIGNETAAYDEGVGAARVAKHLGTEHTAVTITAAEAQAIIPKLPEIYDEPFADSSQIPTCLVSAVARKHVTVSLSGDGGDELFGGYNRHVWGPRVSTFLQLAPPRLRAATARLLRAVKPDRWDQLFAAAPPLRSRFRVPGQKVHKLAGLLSANSPEELYGALSSHWRDEDLPAGESHPLPAETAPSFDSVSQLFMFRDLIGYLPDDILTKVDRASMAVSLESRVPILDHRIVAFAWSLPDAYKVRGSTGKVVLRRVLERYVPPELMSTAKMGFGVPVDDWLRGPLRGWAEALLAYAGQDDTGLFDAARIQTMWSEHLAGRGTWQHHLWDVLMFQAWREHLGRAGLHQRMARGY